MRKQFDILILSDKARDFTLPVKDAALEYFFAEDFRTVISQLDAEWTVLAKPEIILSRDFLNETADLVNDFPYADAFAPRIVSEGKTISSGYLLDSRLGLFAESSLNGGNGMGNVASASPLCGIYSTRLLRALEDFDGDFRTDVRFFDLGLRALHLGANLFSVPHLQIEAKKNFPPDFFPFRELARAYYKDLDIVRFLKFTFRHPTTAPAIFHDRKNLDEKSLRATELSKLTPETLQKITHSAKPRHCMAFAFKKRFSKSSEESL